MYRIYQKLKENQLKAYYLAYEFEVESLYLIDSNGDPIGLQDFCDKYDIKFTNDMQVYMDISYLGKDYKDERMSYEDEEKIDDACIGEGVRELLSILEEFENKFKVNPHSDIEYYLTLPEPYGVFKDIVNTLDQKEYWDNLDTETLKDYSEELDLDYEEVIRNIQNNFYTGGKASRTLINLLNDSELDIERFEGIINAISVARKRHTETDYDLIDKSKMTKDQVDSLRKSYNR